MTSTVQKRLVVFGGLGFAALPAALWCRALGRRVIYIHPMGRFRDEAWIRRLRRLGIEWADFHAYPEFPLSVDLKVKADYASQLIEGLFRAADFQTLAAVVPDAGLDEPMARALLYDDLVSRLQPLSEAYGVAEYFRRRGVTADVFRRPGLVDALLTAGCSTSVANMYPGLWASLPGHLFSGSFAGRLARAIWRRFAAKLTSPPQTRTGPTTLADDPDGHPSGKPSEVLFFPHFGPVYAKLYRKDQFYSQDTASPFHADKIEHVELGWLLSEADRRFISDRYAGIGTPVTFLELINTWSPWDALAMFRRVHARTHGRAAVLRSILITLNALRLQDYCASFARLRGSRIALVGYDILFPAAATAGLRANGIRVVALQERYIHTYYDCYTIAADHYFVHGKAIAERYRANPNAAITELIVTGDPRREKITRGHAEARQERAARFSDFTTVCLVLDFHTQGDKIAGVFNFWTDARSNLFFYDHIAGLAAANLDTAFIIRGKDASWREMPEMAEAVKRFDALPNIFVDDHYETYDRSYHLAAMADLVIARYTSLCDQCLAVGIPVLIYEAMPNGGDLISTWHDYTPYPVLVHDPATLQARFDQVVRQGNFMDKDLFARMRREHYCADGDEALPPTRIIHRSLMRIYDSTGPESKTRLSA